MANMNCPMCHGHGFAVNPRKVGIVDCDTCNGTGKVNPDYHCMCGRPAVIPVADTVVCTRKQCMDKAMGVQAK